MKQTRILTMMLACCFLVISSCKKDEAPKEDYATLKKGWVAGNWKQKDLLLGASTSVRLPNGTRLPLTAGSSMINDPTINALLGSVFGGNPFVLTKNNQYTFGGDGAYAITGDLTYIMPQVEKSGTWTLEIMGAVLALSSKTDNRLPHWINSIDQSNISLGLTVNIPGLGDVPMNLLLEKQ